jgi:PncC family amidohydrolase
MKEAVMQALLDQAGRIAAILVARRQTLAVAESSAGGLISAALLAVPGASSYFRGGSVIYTAQARAAFGVTAEDMEGLRASSPPYAALLADRARMRLGTDWGIAETGAAGPAGNRYGDPAGHACLAVSGPLMIGRTVATGETDRVPNMRAFAAAALSLLEEALQAQSPGS